MTELSAETRIAQDYYDSPDADTFYRVIWGGEDIHVGLYAHGDTIAEASRRTVAHMAGRLSGLKPGAGVLDLGAGYGGAARYLAGEFGAHVTCVNLSKVENERNLALTAAAGLSDRVDVVHGAFETVPAEDSTFDIVWSQDAILHSSNRPRVLAEAARVLRPGGELIFTDPMQADGLSDTRMLQPIYDRIHLQDLASIGFYRKTLGALGLEEVAVEEKTGHLVTHYARVREALQAQRGELAGQVSDEYVDRMLAGLSHWVKAGQAGHLAWGVLHFRKP